MKAQKIELVLGMNLIAACLVMQGCKAVKPATSENVSEAVAVTVTPEPEPAPEVKPTPAPTTPEVKPLPPPAKPAPAVKPLPPPPAEQDGVVHVVASGEVLSSISRRYNVKMSAILAANPGVNADRIRVGQKIRIPGAKAVVAAPAPSVAAANTTPPKRAKRAAVKPYTGATKDYVVKNGDSLGKIAYENGLTIRALKEMNGLTKDIIRVGQKLKVPAEKQVSAKASKSAAKSAAEKPAAAKPEAAKPAEAPAAQQPAEQAVQAEAQQPAPAAAAQQPEAAPAAEQPAADVPPPPAEPAADTLQTYTVKEGDDLVSVSVAWGISPSQLLNVNDLKEGELLKPGQVLRLPPNAKRMDQ